VTGVAGLVARDTTVPPPPIPEGVQVPQCDTTDAGELYAWYGPFGFCDQFRKVVLSNCKEVIRAAMTVQDVKVTEARLDDLAHVHPAYLTFLTTHLVGRIAYEREALKQGFGA